MDQTTSTGYPPRYFDQYQQYAENTISYPPLTSYLLNQQNQTQDQQSYDNSYNQVLTEYASQFYQQQNYDQLTYSNKIQSQLKWNTKRKFPYNRPSSNNIFYCEICKISCAGEQTYKEHCDGQKHKKKELNLKNNSSISNQESTYFCELCQVPCSGLDSFNAHLNGKNHIKVCNLQIKLGKEVPADLISPIMKQPSIKENKKTLNLENFTPNGNTIRVIGTPLVNFVKGECLRTMNDQDKNLENLDKKADNTTSEYSIEQKVGEKDENSIMTQETTKLESSIQDSNDKVQLNNSQVSDSSQIIAEPVGLEFIFEYNLPNSKAVYFSCELCNCKFSEIQAKEQHVRGKRHQKAFKTKFKRLKKSLLSETTSTPLLNNQEPALPTSNSSTPDISKSDSPTSSMQTPLYQTPIRASSKSKSIGLKRPPSFKSLLDNIAKAEKKTKLSHTVTCRLPFTKSIIDDETSTIESFHINMDLSFINSGFTENKFYSNDNRYLYKKHSEIVPKEEDLKQFYRHISNVEKALKLVSDEFVENDNLFRKMLDLPSEDKQIRILQGEIRAGLFGKKLLLRDENQIDLILFCSVKPTIKLLRKIMEILKLKLKLIEDLDYELEENLKLAAIDVKPTNNIKIRITLTSLLVKEQSLANDENEISDPDEMLDKQRMLDSLRALRRFKWYQSKVAPFNPCPMIIRLLRDLGKRNKVWQPITCWTLELICERTMSNFLSPPTAAEAFKYILQTLGSGVLLKDSENDMLIPDPCENDIIDALGYLTEKERLDITESANTLVQYITFNKIYKVLDTEIINFEHFQHEKTHAGNEELNDKNNVEDKNLSAPNLVDEEETTFKK